MEASPAIPGLFLCFTATVLLIFVSVSSPTWNAIYFLNVYTGRYAVHFGVFGYTGSKVAVGYVFNFAPFNNINAHSINNLTSSLILHPIAAGLAGLAFLFGCCGVGYHRSGTILMTLFASLAALVTFVAFIIDMSLFGTARSRFRDLRFYAQYGNACWMTLGALVALWLAVCASACGTFGRYRRDTYSH